MKRTRAHHRRLGLYRQASGRARLPRRAGRCGPPRAILQRSRDMRRRARRDAGPRAPADWSPLLDGVSHVRASRRHRARPGPTPRRDLSPASIAMRSASWRQAARATDRAFRADVVGQGAGRRLAADHVITETDAPQPTDTYGRTKLEAERLLAESGVAFTVLRPAVVYGKGVKGNIAALATLAQTPMPLPFGAARQSPLAARARESRFGRRACAYGAGSRRRDLLVADPSRSASRSSSPPCARGLAVRLTSSRVPAGAVKRLMKTLRQGSRLGARLREFRHRCGEAPGPSAGSPRVRRMTASSP